MNVFFKTFLSEPKNHITKQVSFPKMSSPLGWGSASVCSQSPPGSADSWKKNWCLQTWIWGDSELLINPDAPHRDELQEEAARFRQHTHTHRHIPGPHLCVCVGPVTGSINWQAVTAGHHTHKHTRAIKHVWIIKRRLPPHCHLHSLCVCVCVCERWVKSRLQNRYTLHKSAGKQTLTCAHTGVKGGCCIHWPAAVQ